MACAEEWEKWAGGRLTLRLTWKQDLDGIIGAVACSHRFLD